ncbi:MAG: HD domain-containing protein [Paludibacterium sp.]|uniref:HD-GYP domain-containing protein n=1 Tax=Paludibacterium sp. TaxID=1917523 RepID=UPI0025F91B5B|nr:HD domain-containing phosphohydrolase [Paludibacterium sp.]MBV8047155.1 HD domain-containing protein [Paludibacterium sp.]MBV8647738.1 HD domain-containing protein [Paludibacterium sp.]
MASISLDASALPQGQSRLLLRQVVKSLCKTVEEAEVGTSYHHQGVASLCYLLSRRMGFTREQALSLYLAGSLHDIGKLAIPPGILLAPRRLTEQEYKLVQGHVQASVRILRPLGIMWPDLPIIVGQHHERMDGSGYPAGLKGDAIHPSARILAVVDVAHAMLSKRNYRQAGTFEAVLAELRGPGFDQSVVDVIDIEHGNFVGWLDRSMGHVATHYR